MEETKHDDQYIVMFPFMAQGHIFPFLALAHKLHRSRGFSIVFVSTPLNTNKLRSSYPLDDSSSSAIRFLEIPFNGGEHGLPPNAENTNSLPFNLIQRFMEASQTLKPSFEKLVLDLVEENNGRKPLCLISDIFFPWSAEISRDLGVLHALFFGGSGFGFACFYSLWLNLPHREMTFSGEFRLPDFPEASTLHVTQLSGPLRAADGTDRFSRFNRGICSRWRDTDVFLFNTVEELDRNGLDYFRRTFNVPCWPLGPLLFSRETPHVELMSSEAYMKWLDQKPERSVLYISFGSQNTISASQMMQLAIALEKSCRDFIWVVRPPVEVEFDINSESSSEEWLPEGFEERIKCSNKGFLVHKWASQLKILKHKSVSCFMSHCGWNSILEALCHGVPILAWPLGAEQFYNAKLLEEENGVCVEVAEGKSSEVRGEDIVEKIEMAMNMDNERGKMMRKRSEEIKLIMENAGRDELGFQGSSATAMEAFLNAAFCSQRQDVL